MHHGARRRLYLRGVAACISEKTRNRTGTTTVNTFELSVQELHPITLQPNGSTPESLPTVYQQSPQEAFEAVCVPKIIEPPTPTAPPPKAEPPPPYPGEEAPPTFVVSCTIL